MPSGAAVAGEGRGRRRGAAPQLAHQEASGGVCVWWVGERGAPGRGVRRTLTPSRAPPPSTRRSPSRKLFRFIAGDADTPTAGLPTQSPYARGPIGDDGLLAPALASPSRMPRKIPRTPFKASVRPAALGERGGGGGRLSAAHWRRLLPRGAALRPELPWSLLLRCALPPPPTPLPPTRRRTPPTHPPTRAQVLDAPALADDFYLNLVDWSAQNVLAVGLGSCVYLWSACTSKVGGQSGGRELWVCRWMGWRVEELLPSDCPCTRMCASHRIHCVLPATHHPRRPARAPMCMQVTRLVDFGEGGAVCSVSWSQRGTYLSIGTDKGEVQIWDATKCKR